MESISSFFGLICSLIVDILYEKEFIKRIENFNEVWYNICNIFPEIFKNAFISTKKIVKLCSTSDLLSNKKDNIVKRTNAKRNSLVNKMNNNNINMKNDENELELNGVGVGVGVDINKKKINNINTKLNMNNVDINNKEVLSNTIFNTIFLIIFINFI